MNYLERAQQIEQELALLREDFHRHPEIGNNEVWTSERIFCYLKDLGLEVSRPFGTAIVAKLYGKGSKTVALRSDIDALPVKENTNCSFSAVNDGFMHACGHDIHITSALGSAKLLSENKDNLNGNVVFIFEPDEEGEGNAINLIKHGALDGVSAIFGGHVSPDIPLGKVAVKYGKFYAASEIVTVKVKGLSCHGATPKLGKDALLAASEMVVALQDIKCESGEEFVFTIGNLVAGTASNIIADNAVFSGVLRTFGNSNILQLRESIKNTVDSIAKKYGVEADVIISGSYGGVINSEPETALIEQTARKLFGDSNVEILQDSYMTTEDFGYYIDNCSGSFCNIGAGCNKPLHSCDFLPSSKACVNAVALYCSVIESYLK